MKGVVEYLDDLKGISGSDYKSAKLLEITKESVSIIRKKGQMSDKTAVKMADLLGVDRGELLLAAAMARSEGETKSAWNALAKRLSVAAGWVLVACLSWHGDDIRAAGFNNNAQNIHYAKSMQRLRRRRGSCLAAVFNYSESILWRRNAAAFTTHVGTAYC